MGVDIMTEPRRPGRPARWARNGFITMGLTALLALSYHSAVGASPNTATEHAGHALPAVASEQRPLSSQVQQRPGLPELPPAADNGAAQPGPADAAHPGNRQQVSLEEAAGREHPIGSAGQGAPQGPPPQLREPVLPSQVLESGATGFGGCLQEYGENGQCVPVVPPSLGQHVRDMKAAGGNPNSMEHRWSCGELRKYFKDGVPVRQKGTDPQSLDTNGDGKACSAGDR